MNKFRQYLNSLPIRIVLAILIFGLAYGAQNYWPFTDAESPAPGSHGLQDTYQSGTDKVIEIMAAKNNPTPVPAK